MPKHRLGRAERGTHKQPCENDHLLAGEENLRPVSGQVQMLCVGICVIFAMWVWLLNPIDRLYDDQLNIVTLQLAEEYPENFARDPIYGGNAGDFYPQLYRAIINKLTNQFGLIGGHRIAQFPLMVTYLVVMYFVLYTLTRSVPAALLVSLFSALWQDSMGGSYWGLDRMQAVQPRSFVLIWIPLLLMMAWKYRRSWWLLAVFGVLGLLMNISPPGALFFAIVIWIAMLFESRLTKQRLLQLGAAVATLIIGAAPFIYSHIIARTEAVAVLSLQDRQLFMEALEFRFARMSSFPVSLRTVCTVIISFSFPLLLATAGWCLRGQKRSSFDRWLLIFFVIAVAGFVAVQYIMQKVSASLDRAPPIVNVHRGQKYAYLVLYIYAAVFLRHLFEHMGRLERRSLIAVAAILVAALPLVTFAHRGANPDKRWENNVTHLRKLIRGEKVETTGWYDMLVPVCQWVRTNTPPDSLFLFGHNNMPLFRIYALRSIVSSTGCGGIALYNGPQKLIHWHKAQKVLERLTSKGGVEQLVKLAEETGSNYIILSRNVPSVPGWTPMAYDRYWVVYGPESASSGGPVQIRSSGLSFRD